MKELYIIRHGETDFNRQGIVQGSGVNSSLNENGKLQALHFFNKYKDVEFDYVYSSTLKRTHETVQHFINKGITWRVRAEIREISWGIHEGQKGTKESIQRYKNLIEYWNDGNFDARLEGGESAAEMVVRLNHFLEELKRTDFKRALICSHGRTLRCLMCLINNDHLREMDNYQHWNTGLYIVELNADVFKIVLHKDVSHLE
ncbi:MAG: putative phosphoglycerate mutase [Saprospiraceae bacterium]|jgi:broad specificity phosphatase PhoE